jgi:uncharacterized protein YprB with RNaseH-like and TPR domain
MMDLTSRLRSIVNPSTRSSGVRPGQAPVRELTYEPDDGYRREAVMDLAAAGAALGGVAQTTPFGDCLVIDRRYEGDRWHGAVRIGDCDLDSDGLRLLDPSLAPGVPEQDATTVFLDLETTGLSGGAGTIAFLVGCGWFDAGAFQVRQFLLTSHSAERALLAAVAQFLADAGLIVTYNGKTFDVPVMETRWAFHRIPMPLEDFPHFDMLHTARRLWRRSTTVASVASGFSRTDADGCRLVNLERALLNFHRVGDVPGMEIPSRYFHFLRTGDARPLEPVLEHNRLDLVSLAAVTARAARLARDGEYGCSDEREALALGRIYERAEEFNRAEACYRRAGASGDPEVSGEAWCRLAVRCRRERRFTEAAEYWRRIVALTEPAGVRRRGTLNELRHMAIEALAIHHEHRDRDLTSARELALFGLQEGDARRADGLRHRLARLDRKLAGRAQHAPLFPA